MKKEIFSLVPDYLPLGVIVYDNDGRLKYANAMALEVFGAKMEDVYDINLFDDPNITAEDKDRLRRKENVSFETDYNFDLCRNTFYKTSIVNTHKYFVTKITIMRDAMQTPLGYLLNCEDVTAKKAQERELVNSYKKIQSTQRELALALNAGNLISWNYQVGAQKLYKVGGSVDSGEVKSFESIRERVHPDDREAFVALLDTALQKQTSADNNNIVVRIFDPKNKNYRHYNFVYSIREDDKGDVEGITFIQRDITEDVERQQNLILAKDKAEEADKLKSTFLATMSHEIRTPLNAIVGFSQLLSEATDETEKNDYKQLIETNSEILLQLIGDILDLSKIEAGSIDIERHPLDLTQVCQELYHSFQQRIHNPNVTLRLVNPYAKCIANLDKHRFIQVFTNFVTNAIKYTPQGEIVMGYECTPGQVRIYVKDTGIGIPNQKKYRIFSRFEKLDNFAQGTGLGLSICKAIADASGGKVGFESKENEGSEFWYVGYTEIDYVEKSHSTEETQSSPVAMTEVDSAALSTNLQALNLLVAEDNDSNYVLVKTILKECHLTRAITGIEAVERAKVQHFDAIFMDMKMPMMGGLEATRLIREFDHRTPIIALTANAFNADKEAALAAGCNYFITKPIKKQEFMDLLSKLWIVG